MKNADVRSRSYHSPLRAARRTETTTRILRACRAVVERGEELTFVAVAAESGVQERTVYRHFATKEDLESAFWWWQQEQVAGAETFEARTLEALVANMKRSFAGFEANTQLVEAMLASRQGLRVREQGNEARQRMVLACLRDAAPEADEAAVRRAAAAAQVLYSAASWQMLRRWWGLDAAAAAEVVERALVAITRDLRDPTP